VNDRPGLGYDSAYTAIVEVPLNKWVEKGASKLKLSLMLAVPLDLLKIRHAYFGKSRSAK
jgi:hypothetical protein